MAGRVTQIVVESLEQLTPKSRVTQIVIETLEKLTPKARITQSVVEILRRTSDKIRTTQIIVEVLRSTSGAASFDESVSFSSIAGFTRAIMINFDPSVSFTSIANVTFNEGTITFNATLTLAANANVIFTSTGNTYEPSITFVAIANIITDPISDILFAVGQGIIFQAGVVKEASLTFIADAEVIFDGQRGLFVLLVLSNFSHISEPLLGFDAISSSHEHNQLSGYSTDCQVSFNPVLTLIVDADVTFVVDGTFEIFIQFCVLNGDIKKIPEPLPSFDAISTCNESVTFPEIFTANNVVDVSVIFSSTAGFTTIGGFALFDSIVFKNYTSIPDPLNSFDAISSSETLSSFDTVLDVVFGPEVTLNAFATITFVSSENTFEPSIIFSSTAGFILIPNNVIDTTLLFSVTSFANFAAGFIIEFEIIFNATPNITFDLLTTFNNTLTLNATPNLQFFPGQVILRSLAQTLLLTQSHTRQRLIIRSLETIINFTNTVIAGKVYVVEIENDLIFTHQAIRVIEVFASNILYFNAIYHHIPENLLSHDAIATQNTNTEAEYDKIMYRETENELELVSILNQNFVFKVEADNILEFQTTFYQLIPIDNEVIAIPDVTVVKLPKKCIVTLQVDNSIIILPCPLLNDTQNLSGTQLLQKKSVVNDLYTYARQTDLQKLKYTFILDRKKSKELKVFLANNMTILIKMINWKGEIWLVKLINTAFDLVFKSRGERVEVLLEFEGVKIAG